MSYVIEKDSEMPPEKLHIVADEGAQELDDLSKIARLEEKIKTIEKELQDAKNQSLILKCEKRIQNKFG